MSSGIPGLDIAFDFTIPSASVGRLTAALATTLYVQGKDDMGNTPLYIILIAVIPVIISQLIVQWRFRKNTDQMAKAFAEIKMSILWASVLLILLLLFIPSSHSITYFAYPESVSDIHDSEQLLQTVQKHNDVLARTVVILQWAIFLVVFMLLVPAYHFIKVMMDTRGVPAIQSPEPGEARAERSQDIGNE